MATHLLCLEEDLTLASTGKNTHGAHGDPVLGSWRWRWASRACWRAILAYLVYFRPLGNPVLRK